MLDLIHYKFLTVGHIISVELRHHATFRDDRSNQCRDISISDFLKFQFFNGRNGPEGRTASACQILSKSLEPRQRHVDFSIFQDGGRRHLGFVMRMSDHPRRAFGCLYHCAKFGWNRCSSFDNMHVFRFCEFGLKAPIHAPKLGFWGFCPS